MSSDDYEHVLNICHHGVKNINDARVIRHKIKMINNINFAGLGGTTLLSTAMTNKHPDLIYFLIDNGSNFCGKERQIVNYLVQLNCRKYELKLRIRKLKYLLEDPTREILRCLPEEDQEEYLLSHQNLGFNESEKNIFSDFFFNKYVEERHFQSIYFLNNVIKKGANINNQLKNGDTPLHYACDNGYYYLSEFLIKNDAQTNIRNNNGDTPLSLFTNKKSDEYRFLYGLHITQQWKRRICFIYILLGNEILFILNRFSYERQEEIKKENDKKYSALRQVLHNFFLRIEICKYL